MNIISDLKEEMIIQKATTTINKYVEITTEVF